MTLFFRWGATVPLFFKSETKKKMSAQNVWKMIVVVSASFVVGAATRDAMSNDYGRGYDRGHADGYDRCRFDDPNMRALLHRRDSPQSRI
jgi:hypothetical protein